MRASFLGLCTGCRLLCMIVCALLVTASLLTDFSSGSALVWQRDALAGGEWWRLLSAHIVHLSPRHLLMNLLGLILVTELFCEQLSNAEILSLTLLSAFGVSGLLWLLQPQLQWYAGFSGVLHGLWSGGAARVWQTERKRIGLIAWLALAAKLVLVGDTRADIPVIAQAHAYGAICGLIWLLLRHVSERCRIFDYNTRSQGALRQSSHSARLG